MAKKKRKKQNKILSYLSLALGVVVIGLMLLDVVKFTGKVFGTESAFSGFNVIFGYTKTAESFGIAVKTEILAFSFLALVAVLLPVIGGIIQLSQNKALKLVGAVCALGGAIMLFVMPSFVVFATDTIAAVYSAATASLAIGGIIAGIVASLEAVIIGYQLLTK